MVKSIVQRSLPRFVIARQSADGKIGGLQTYLPLKARACSCDNSMAGIRSGYMHLLLKVKSGTGAEGAGGEVVGVCTERAKVS